MSCYLNIYVQIYASQISHPYDIDTCTIKEQCLSLEMFNLEIVPYHTLCLYVEYAVLCGNKVLLNFEFEFETSCVSVKAEKSLTSIHHVGQYENITISLSVLQLFSIKIQDSK